MHFDTAHSRGRKKYMYFSTSLLLVPCPVASGPSSRPRKPNHHTGILNTLQPEATNRMVSLGAQLSVPALNASRRAVGMLWLAPLLHVGGFAEQMEVKSMG